VACGVAFVLLAVAALAWSATAFLRSARLAVVSAIVIVLAIVSVAADVRSIVTRSGLTIEIRDRGGWWELRYARDGVAFSTANEMHVPRGSGVRLEGVRPAPKELHVIVDSPEEFERWFRNESSTASGDGFLFTGSGCNYCHLIRGVTAQPAMAAPDLTHFGSRTTIGATPLPNSPGNLAGWIANSHSLKPNSGMPNNPLEAADLHRIVAFLEALR